MSQKKWRGSTPVCDFCQTWSPDAAFFVDGRTKYDVWAIMCPMCFLKHGLGLGDGMGQAYDMHTKEHFPDSAVLGEFKRRVDTVVALIEMGWQQENN